MKKLVSSIVMIIASLSAVAQPAQVDFWSDPLNHPLTPFYALMLFLAIVIVLVMLVAVSMIRVLNTLSRKAEQERAEKLGIVYKARPSLWTRFLQQMNASVPVEEERNIELDHNYDGIKELDNHLPPWWKYLFYATIVWSVIYIFVYHFSDSLPLQEQEYRNEVAKADELKRKFLATQPKLEIDENTLAYKEDAAILSAGKELYTINCAPCHKADGGGGIGPNLTDEYWLHNGDIRGIFATIKNGVPEKGMVSWAGVMSPQQLRDVSFFVMSLKGTNPPGAKGPQGNIFKTTQSVQADSSKIQAKL